MEKISRETLIRLEWIKLDYYGDYEIWGYDNERMLWNPKTEEVVNKYKKERSSGEKRG